MLLQNTSSSKDPPNIASRHALPHPRVILDGETVHGLYRTTMNAQPTLHVDQKSTLTTVPSSTHLYPDTENIVPHNGCD